MLKKIYLSIFLLAFMAASAQAYIINFEAHSSVESGESFTISGTSTLPAGFTSEIEFYKKAQVGNNKVAEMPFTIQDGGVWSVEVNTEGWQAGEYTMSIPRNAEYSFGSSSNLLKIFTVTKSAEKTAAASPEITQTTVPLNGDATGDVSAPQNTPQTTSASLGLWIYPAGLIAVFLMERGRIHF